MTPTTAPVAEAPAKEVDLSLLELLGLTGGIPPDELREVAGGAAATLVEILDSDDSPF